MSIDTLWVLIAAALVFFMQAGFALIEAGFTRQKNTVNIMTKNIIDFALGSLLFWFIGFGLMFGADIAGFIGTPDLFFQKGWEGGVSSMAFLIFQTVFAATAATIVSGAMAERTEFKAYFFYSIAITAVIYPVSGHWVWGGGWLMADGALDFAGGTVVHINAGVAGIVLAAVLGKRNGYNRDPMAPSNLALTLIGTGLIWVGWFGFNGGSALAANALAGNALLVTQVAAAAGALTWFAIEKLVRGKASVLGGASGAVAGLVGITPAAGFVTVAGALAIGIITSLVCFYAVNYLKRLLKIDDSLDAFGLHGVGGIVGAILTGVFVSPAITGKPLALSTIGQVWVQLEGVFAVIIYCAIVTFIIAKVIQLTMGLRVTDEDEYTGLDLAVHGERIE